MKKRDRPCLQQLTADVVHPRGKPLARRSQLWSRAIAVLLKDARLAGVSHSTRLPVLAEGVQDGWLVRRGGLWFRCLVQYRLVPWPAEYVGRVDIAWESR